jgi:hypothetical protein
MSHGWSNSLAKMICWRITRDVKKLQSSPQDQMVLLQPKLLEHARHTNPAYADADACVRPSTRSLLDAQACQRQKGV